jgi:sphinganine-1-phosphate aldolase
MVLPITAHASLFKAAHYLGIKPVVTPVHDDTFLADVEAMRAAVTDNTILLVGSAPGYSHGIVDPITEIVALAKEKGLLCHVDACVGGIHLSYMRKLGYEVPDFNLNVPGVTGVEPPESMEKVYLLLEALPYDVSEFMLTEYLNNMMLPGGNDEP